MRVLLDTPILVRASGASRGPAREVLLWVIEAGTLVLSNEILYELARVSRSPRMLALLGLPAERVHEYVGFRREAAEIVELNPLLQTSIRDPYDVIVMQTAVLGDAEVICTRDRDFFEPPADAFLKQAGIMVLDDSHCSKGCAPSGRAVGS